MAVAVLSTLCLLCLCLSQIIVECVGDNNRTNETLESQLLSVAKVLNVVDQAGGPRKILQDPHSKELPSEVQEVLQNLANIEGKPQNATDQWEVKPRSFIRGLMHMGAKALCNAFTNLFAPAPTTPDPELAID